MTRVGSQRHSKKKDNFINTTGMTHYKDIKRWCYIMLMDLSESGPHVVFL